MDKRYYFEDISIPDEPSCLILLDLDGTLMPDIPGDTSIESAVKEKVAQFSQHHSVYICTNGKNHDRARKIASELGISFVDSRYKKHNKKILNDIPLDPNRQTIVIGDKILTDGLLARRLDAHFYLIKRKKSGKESLFVRLVEYLDDAIAALISL